MDDLITRAVKQLHGIIEYVTATDWRLTSYYRPDSKSHRTGLAFDFAPTPIMKRYARTYGQDPFLNRRQLVLEAMQMSQDLFSLTKTSERVRPIIAVESDHIHVTFFPASWVDDIESAGDITAYPFLEPRPFNYRSSLQQWNARRDLWLDGKFNTIRRFQ